MISVREVMNEIRQYHRDERVLEWLKAHRQIFEVPTAVEIDHVKAIFEVPHFQQLVRVRNIQLGLPAADPFLIAKARALDGTVVTQEQYRQNAARIPNVCEHFGVPWTDLEGFMEQEGWEFGFVR